MLDDIWDTPCCGRGESPSRPVGTQRKAVPCSRSCCRHQRQRRQQQRHRGGATEDTTLDKQENIGAFRELCHRTEAFLLLSARTRWRNAKKRGRSARRQTQGVGPRHSQNRSQLSRCVWTVTSRRDAFMQTFPSRGDPRFERKVCFAGQRAMLRMPLLPYEPQRIHQRRGGNLTRCTAKLNVGPVVRPAPHASKDLSLWPQTAESRGGRCPETDRPGRRTT